jgi:hypothetical protein
MADGPPQRVHDVADPATGRLTTFPVPGALSARTRASRVRRLGYAADAAVFATALQELTPSAPFHASPRAWLDAFDGTYSSGASPPQVWWRLPATFETTFMPGVNLSFQGPPAGPALVSWVIDAWPYQGMTGHLVVDIGALRTEVAVSVAARHVLDIAFAHPGGLVDARLFFRAGMIDVLWLRAALRRLPAAGG